MTVLAVLQSLVAVVKVRVAGSAVTSVLSVGSVIVTVTSATGLESSTTVYSPVPSSSIPRVVGSTVTPAESSSTIVTTASLGVPRTTPSGRVPKVAMKDSPSSSIESCLVRIVPVTCA